MEKKEYNDLQALHFAGMILVTEDIYFSLGEEPKRDIYSKAMDYKVALAKNSHEKINKILEDYLNLLSKEERKFLEEKSGIYTGLPEIMSKKDSDNNIVIMTLLASLERAKGLLRKLAS